ncbi:MAG: glycosyltransferase family 4 protein [Candidatus Limnocylindrales bacterium]
MTDSYPPYVGGADRQIELIATEMAARGYTVLVATPWQPGLAELERPTERLTVHRIKGLTTRVSWFFRDPSRRSQPPFPDPATTLALRRIIGRIRPDVVHSYGWISYSAALAVTGMGVPLLLSVRDHGHICAVRYLMQYGATDCSGPALAKCLGCAAATYVADEALGSSSPLTLTQRLRGISKGIVAVASIRLAAPLLRAQTRWLHVASRHVATTTQRWLFRGSSAVPVSVIPSFLAEDPTTDADLAALERLPAEDFVLFVGRLVPQKGIAQLLEAWQDLSPRPTLVLIGPRTHQTPASFPDGVVVLPPMSHAGILGAWDRAMFGVMPSLGGETFGSVAVEAMSRGRAMVASSTGGLRDIIRDGDDGILVPPGDVEALRGAMQRLLDDPALRDRLGTEARMAARRFAAEAVLPGFEALYLRAAGREERA